MLRPVDKIPTLGQKEVVGKGVRDGQNDGKILSQNSGPTTEVPEIIYIKNHILLCIQTGEDLYARFSYVPS